MFDFYMTGLYQKPKNFLLSTFAVALEEYSGKSRPVPKNWMTAMQQLKEYLASLSNKRRVLVFIDGSTLPNPIFMLLSSGFGTDGLPIKKT